MTEHSWDDGTWTTEPEAMARDGAHLLVTAREGSDFWRTTSYGFVHDDGHGLLADFPDRSAAEVSFVAAFEEQFDQAGILAMADHEHWVKAGVEYADGAAQLGAVVTSQLSDWSTGQVAWAGRLVTVRVSRDGDALTVRGRVDEEPWRLVRVAPIDGSLPWRAGPMTCAPTRAGLTIRFTRWTVGPADTALH
ncbi:MAG TPA: DUF1349 domain-containing protein [Candidatus Nanopelagicales bacterium]|nr:DUF1349 domain-containing protein [Candidatus Nanopelagicales bacterium]